MLVMLIANSDGSLYNFRSTLISKLISSGNTVVTISGSSSEGSYKQRLESLGVEHQISFDFSGSKVAPMSFLRLILEITCAIRKYSPNIVHCYTHKACLAGSIGSILSGSNAKVFFTITGLGRAFSSDEISYRVIRATLLLNYRILSKKVSRFFFQNYDDASLFEKKCDLPKEKIEVVGGSGVDLELVRKQIKKTEINNILPLKINKNRINILCLSRGMIQKGFFEFYKAAKILSEIFPDKYTFYHAGTIDNEVLDKINNKDINKFAKLHCVDYLGYVNEVITVISEMDIIVHPSYYREGVPRSLIEALALDKVIVTCDTIGNREVVFDGWNGFFCKPKNAQSLASKIIAVDIDFLIKSKGRSYLIAEKKFDVRKIDEAVLRAYTGKH